MGHDGMRLGQNVGEGCTTRQSGLPPHNPEPSTKRGSRRNAKRSKEQVAVATKAWATPRSNNISRYQKALTK